MDFRALGHLEVALDDQALALGSHQQRAVLAVLVLCAGEVVSSDRLIESLWGERPPATAAKTVQVYISRLRKTLNGASTGDEPIVTADHGYVLRVAPEEIDVRVFERLLDEGRRAYAAADHDTAAAVMREALALWRGPALSDFTFDPFAAREIARLEELRLEALETRIDADLALGRHAELISELEALSAQHPLRERPRATLMLALYRCRREPEALAVYRDTRRMLVEELGVEPSPALQELHDAILRHDPALEPAAASAQSARGRRGRRPVAVAALGLAGGVAAVVALIAHHGMASAAVAPNSVAVIDPGHNTVVRDVGVGVRPGDISAGAGGLWVANLDDQSLSNIDPRTATLKRTLSIPGSDVDALAAGRDDVWTMDYARATATEIDPGFGDPVRRVKVGEPRALGAALPSPIAVAGGAVWASTGTSSVARIPAGSSRTDLTVNVGNEPAAIAVGDGAAWVADDLDNTVSRIDADGVVTSTPPVGNGASAIAIGYGSVWVANTLADTVTRIDAATGATTTTIPVGDGPRGVAVGAGGVWVADSRGASVSRIDPRTNRARTIAVGGSPEDVAVDAGRVWVTVQGGVPPRGRPVAGGTLRVVQQKDFGATDPAVMGTYGPQGGQLQFATSAMLLSYPDLPAPQGRRLVPDAATAMPALSRDGRTYTFTIRRGLRFSPPSNQPVIARAFQRAIERLLDPRMHSALAGDLSGIAGARAYEAGRARRISGVSATDTTLTIRLVRPDPSLPARMAMPQLTAVPPDTPIREGGVVGIPSAGPYYIRAHTRGAELVLRRNPNYRGRRPRRFAEIDYRFGTTPAQAAALVRAGQSDYADAAFGFGYLHSTPPAAERRLERDFGAHSAAARAGRQRFFVNRTPALQYLLLNSHRPLFATPRIRRAVNFAVDRAVLAANAGSGFSGLPTDQYLPNGMPGFRDADIYPLGAPDVARARRLAGRHHRHAIMYTCQSTTCLRLAETVQRDLRAIGIAVRFRQVPAPAIFSLEGKPGAPYDIGWWGWVADYADPSTFIGGASGAFPGGARAATPRGYAGRLAAAGDLTGDRRLRAYGRLDIDLATRAAPAIPFADLTAHDFFSARIGCQIYQPFYGMDLGQLCIRRP